MAGTALARADEAMASVVPVKHAILRGVVKSVSWADPVKGTESVIVVMDTARKKTKILVAPTTTLWDEDAKAIMPEKIVVKKKVYVIYITTDEGVDIAKSIKILK